MLKSGLNHLSRQQLEAGKKNKFKDSKKYFKTRIIRVIAGYIS